MLRPERMSKVSVTGSKRVMDEVIETVHGLRLLDVTDYDGTWEGFTPGDPVEGAESASDELVTVRSIESILGVDRDAVESRPTVSVEEIGGELDELRDEVNRLDERRDEIDEEIREIDERIDETEPFAALGIDLDLLSGYRSLDVAVGRGDRDAVESAVADADELREYEIATGDDGDVVAVFARPTDDAEEGALDDALVGAEFAALEIPGVDGAESPEQYVERLRDRREELVSRRTELRRDLDAIRDDRAGFLVAAEEALTIRVQRAEAPLSFATTENVFVAEGWIPTTRFDEFAGGVSSAAGDHAEIEELERASFSRHGEAAVRERVHDGEGEAVATDGGTASEGDVVMSDDTPPVVQSNPGPTRPFQTLTNAYNLPRYDEFDPTAIVFLTFPLFFGFMIGDLGYGLLYTLIGGAIYSRFDGSGIESIGAIGIYSGVSTMIFGVLYGEIFGLHLITTYLWEGVFELGGPIIEKGISPAASEWALTWLVLSVIAGLIHMDIGWLFDFAENYELHGLGDAVLESGSWLLLTNSLWFWIFSRQAAGTKPEFLYTVFDGEPFPLGFSGFSNLELFVLPIPGLGELTVTLSLLLTFVGAAMVIAAEGLALMFEVINAFAHVLSYARLMAVLLAKAGMAFTVNLLFFGAYSEPTPSGAAEYHFMLSHGPDHIPEAATVMFPGLVHGSILSVLFGVAILLVGHLIVLALGVSSAGLQAIRLEYVEFFGKFYEGGGRPYQPFGYDRSDGAATER